MSAVIAYKEWEPVCEALGRGQQCLLLRKGGIHEGRGGFAFKHDRFFLFPTRFHEQAQQVRVPFNPAGGEWEPGDQLSIRYFCEALWARTLTDWETVSRLDRFHVWRERVVRERFDCGDVQQIHCALVRVSALPEPMPLSYEKKYGGCRSWVEIPVPPGNWEQSLQPALSQGDFERLKAEVETVMKGP